MGERVQLWNRWQLVFASLPVAKQAKLHGGLLELNIWTPRNLDTQEGLCCKRPIQRFPDLRKWAGVKSLLPSSNKASPVFAGKFLTLGLNICFPPLYGKVLRVWVKFSFKPKMLHIALLRILGVFGVETEKVNFRADWGEGGRYRKHLNLEWIRGGDVDRLKKKKKQIVLWK